MHWQTWFETQISGSLRVIQDDWDKPHITPWAKTVERAIIEAREPSFIIAHSFGVLASIMGAANVADKVAGALFVAPADPSRFTIDGKRIANDSSELDTGLFNYIPKKPLGYPCVLAVSINDYCMPFKRSAWWSKIWGARLVSLGNAGHVNAESGFGPWPEGLALYNDVVKAAKSEPAKWMQFESWAF